MALARGSSWERAAADGAGSAAPAPTASAVLAAHAGFERALEEIVQATRHSLVSAHRDALARHFRIPLPDPGGVKQALSPLQALSPRGSRTRLSSKGSVEYAAEEEAPAAPLPSRKAVELMRPRLGPVAPTLPEPAAPSAPHSSARVPQAHRQVPPLPFASLGGYPMLAEATCLSPPESPLRGSVASLEVCSEDGAAQAGLGAVRGSQRKTAHKTAAVGNTASTEEPPPQSPRSPRQGSGSERAVRGDDETASEYEQRVTLLTNFEGSGRNSKKVIFSSPPAAAEPAPAIVEEKEKETIKRAMTDPKFTQFQPALWLSDGLVTGTSSGGRTDRSKRSAQKSARKLTAVLHHMSKVHSTIHTSEKMMSVWRRFLEWRVSSSKKSHLVVNDLVMTVLIVCNAVIIGISMDYYPDWFGWVVADAVFSVIFLGEMCVKLRAYGVRTYFCGKNPVANVVESCIVLLSVVEVVLSAVAETGGNETRILFTLLRTMRLFRIARVLRVARMPMFGDLLMMVNGCAAGVKTLFWSQLLLSLPLYLAALVFRETVGEGNMGTGTQDTTGAKGFETVGWAFFTMYRCFVAGECFSEDGNPIFLLLMKKYGNGYGAAYHFLSAVMSFGIHNVVAAIFVESTVASAKYNELRQKQGRLTDRKIFTENTYKLVELIWSCHEDNATEQKSIRDVPDEELAEIQITPQLFQQVRQLADFQQVLCDLDIAFEDQVDLFETLDVDASGTLDLEELIVGIEKMRGDARRSDVVSVNLRVRALAEEMTSALEDIREHMSRHNLLFSAWEARRYAAVTGGLPAEAFHDPPF